MNLRIDFRMLTSVDVELRLPHSLRSSGPSSVASTVTFTLWSPTKLKNNVPLKAVHVYMFSYVCAGFSVHELDVFQ